MGIPLSSNAFKTPTWARPLAAPPLKTNPTFCAWTSVNAIKKNMRKINLINKKEKITKSLTKKVKENYMIFDATYKEAIGSDWTGNDITSNFLVRSVFTLSKDSKNSFFTG